MKAGERFERNGEIYEAVLTPASFICGLCYFVNVPCPRDSNGKVLECWDEKETNLHFIPTEVQE